MYNFGMMDLGLTAPVDFSDPVGAAAPYTGLYDNGLGSYGYGHLLTNTLSTGFNDDLLIIAGTAAAWDTSHDLHGLFG